ncbi:antibiotic biosynthesis monooxygenase [Streptomyces sp. NPDC008001]|uniref:antibiotic biosynthesis monooxygenase n=1 Tax=Streptomyces sp. NPDC008001 TaxID=3364804 RepID=UPI0036E8BF4B
MTKESGFYSIIDYTVDGPETQRALLKEFTEIQKSWVRFYPGYRSAQFHLSTDGTRVVNLIHWATEADYRNFVENSDTDGRLAAIRQALENLPGKAEINMPGAPTYLAYEVTPGPRP